MALIYVFSSDHMNVSSNVELGLEAEKNHIQNKGAPTENANQDGSHMVKSTCGPFLTRGSLRGSSWLLKRVSLHLLTKNKTLCYPQKTELIPLRFISTHPGESSTQRPRMNPVIECFKISVASYLSEV
jgi:hypothetical protein